MYTQAKENRFRDYYLCNSDTTVPEMIIFTFNAVLNGSMNVNI